MKPVTGTGYYFREEKHQSASNFLHDYDWPALNQSGVEPN